MGGVSRIYPLFHPIELSIYDRLWDLSHFAISDRPIVEEATRNVNFSSSRFFAEKGIPFCFKNNTVHAIPVRLLPSIKG